MIVGFIGLSLIHIFWYSVPRLSSLKRLTLVKNLLLRLKTCWLPVDCLWACALSLIHIYGVLHEYSTKEGVQEDILEILLNLKGLAVRVQGKDERCV